MNNNIFRDLRFKIFQSGNPLFFYIGINALIFIATALIALIAFLTRSNFDVYALVRNYLGLPADVSKLPERFYTIFSYMFFHDGVFHLFFNMLGLFWFGQIFMNFLKSRQFHFVFISGGFAGALFFLLGLNIFPAFSDAVNGITVIGASGAVMAIIAATATLAPNYTIFMLLLGEVKIKYLALAYFVIDLIGLGSINAGGSFAHVGGAVLGFFYIKSLQNGRDWSKIFERKPKLRVVKQEQPIKKSAFQDISQKEIDEILDKISKSGYDKLTSSEKEKLFKASKD